MPNSLREGLSRYFSPEQINQLRSARIGLAGAGGIGSNAAMLLARSGIEHFLIIDRDIIDKSNLNRQHYWPDQVGQPKVEALARHLLRLNPHIVLKIIHDEITTDSLDDFLPQAQIWLEALDDPFAKKAIVDAALAANIPIIAASGIAGYGHAPLTIRQLGSLTVVGDFCTDVSVAPPIAPRVTQAAALMADTAITLILKPHSRPILPPYTSRSGQGY